jgi:hypothetical protein
MNPSRSGNPGYSDLVVDFYKAFVWSYRDAEIKNYSFPSGFVSDFKLLYRFEVSDYLSIIAWGVIFTLIRFVFESVVCKVKLFLDLIKVYC